jgi:oligoendopeptidase F
VLYRSFGADLSDLYSSLEDPRLAQDMQELQAQAGRFRETYRGWVAMLTPLEVRTALQTLESLWERVGYAYA